MAGNPYYNFIPAGNQQAAGTQAYGASAGPSPGYSAGGHSAPAAGQTSYDTAHTAYPNTAAFAEYYHRLNSENQVRNNNVESGLQD
ncbi:hypothetical protein DAPPUDRAFT_248989 [Daphnia pulex]|uniref:Uncharacterized protein n=1 Tax=Daphnia pulex TaxID=6669 RepID=E9GVM0_DAPPU|nr:hypothetical protein DAPPUDRAFT_248989 [Daphnia pulex]|eukprot:EFX76435.1 hypothetical protein DAPPUDRAFT_248989 [Daphnia pulex]